MNKPPPLLLIGPPRVFPSDPIFLQRMGTFFPVCFSLRPQRNQSPFFSYFFLRIKVLFRLAVPLPLRRAKYPSSSFLPMLNPLGPRKLDALFTWVFLLVFFVELILAILKDLGAPSLRETSSLVFLVRCLNEISVFFAPSVP